MTEVSAEAFMSAPAPVAKTVSTADFMGAPPKTPDQPPSSELGQRVLGIAKTAASQTGAEVRDWWGEMGQMWSQAGEEQKKNWAADQAEHSKSGGGVGSDVLADAKFTGQSLLNLVNTLWSPVSAAVDVAAVKPAQAQVSKLGQAIAAKAPNKVQSNLGFDKAKVNTYTDAINDTLSFVMQTAAGLYSGEEAPKLPGEILTPVKPSPEALKVAGSKVDAAFDDLAVRHPPAATALAEQVAKVDPPLGKALKLRIKLKPTMSDAQAAGESVATHAFEGEGAPGANLWGRIHDDMAPVFEKAANDKPEPKPMMEQQPFDPNGESGSKPIGVHELLDKMIASAKRNSTVSAASQAAQDLLTKLRSKVDDVPVTFHDHLEGTSDSTKSIWGMYYPSEHKIQVAMGQHTTQTLVHEIVHAATSRYIRRYPQSPLVKELGNLFELTKTRMDRVAMKEGGAEKPYGMTDLHEFVAEALSSPSFQSFLKRSGHAAQPGDRAFFRNVWNKFSYVVHKILGTDKGKVPIDDRMTDHTLLNSVIANGYDMIDEQASARMQIASEGVSRASLDTYPIIAREVEEDPWNPRTKGLGMAAIEGRMKGYWREILRTVHPEGLSKDAKLAGAILAKNLSEQMKNETWFRYASRERQRFWNQNPTLIKGFVEGYEKGKEFAGTLGKAATAYREWTSRILTGDAKLGIEYDPIDHYFPHLFQDPKQVEAWMKSKFGSSWTEPGFTKDRQFDLYKQATAAGFRPRYTNPEDIMLARQHASDVAKMKIQTLEDMSRMGLAVEAEKGEKIPDWLATRWPSPNGKAYWVHNDAAALMNNAFNSTSLWAMKGMVGDAFRGAMTLKNTIVPLKLAVSLFHPLHILGIDIAATWSRATRGLLTGKVNPLDFLSQTLRAPSVDLFSNPKLGNSLLRAMRAQTDVLSDADRQSLQFITEGGLVPEMSGEFRTRAMDKFRDALDKHHALGATFHLPFAVLDSIQGVVFNQWIPRLKIASYLKDVRASLAGDPKLMEDEPRRLTTFRALAKSVDNRYGEMSYNTLFWKPWVKDLAVMNTLSLGWTMGFVREYGGGMLDLGKLAKGDKTGLDRPLFVAFYTGQALMAGGLITYAMTGKGPQGWMDYIYPRTGDTNPDGSPKRVSMMYYTREIAGMAKHIQQDGLMSGLSDFVLSKSSGLLGMMGEWARGTNSWGQEIRDPNSPVYKQVEQTLASTLKDVEPISMEGWQARTGKDRALSLAGLNPAPKYVTKSPASAEIQSLYQKYHASGTTAYDQAARSQDTSSLRQMWDSGNVDGFSQGLQALQEKYNISGTQVKQMVRDIAQGRTGEDRMFQDLSPQEQRRVWQRMTDDEKQKFARFVHRKQAAEIEQ